MKNRIFITAYIVFSLSTVILTATDNRVNLTFFIGDVSIQKTGNSIIPAQINMSLDPNDLIKTGHGSQAELTICGNVFYVDENKSVRIGDLVPGDNPPVLIHALKKIRTSSRQSKITTTAGIRADRQEEEITWATDSTSGTGNTQPPGTDDETLSQMASLLGSGQYDMAYKFYAIKKVSEVSRDRMNFMGALALFHLCRYHEALALFNKLVKSSADINVKSESLFYAGLSFYSMARFKDAISCLTDYIEKHPGDTYTAQSFFLRGVCYKNTGQRNRAKDDLKQVTTLYPSNPLAKDAKDILAQL